MEETVTSKKKSLEPVQQVEQVETVKPFESVKQVDATLANETFMENDDSLDLCEGFFDEWNDEAKKPDKENICEESKAAKSVEEYQEPLSRAGRDTPLSDKSNMTTKDNSMIILMRHQELSFSEIALKKKQTEVAASEIASKAENQKMDFQLRKQQQDLMEKMWQENAVMHKKMLDLFEKK